MNLSQKYVVVHCLNTCRNIAEAFILQEAIQKSVVNFTNNERKMIILIMAVGRADAAMNGLHGQPLPHLHTLSN